MIQNYKLFINESIRDQMTPKSEEEINIAWQNKIDKIFEQAYMNKRMAFNWSEIDTVIWHKCTDKYFLYDNYYLYKDRIFYLQQIDNDFDDLYNYKSIEEFKLESQNKIKEIESTLKKL